MWTLEKHLALLRSHVADTHLLYLGSYVIPPVSPKNGYGETVESCDKKRQVGSANLMDKNAMA